jgi:hypothetical protein
MAKSQNGWPVLTAVVAAMTVTAKPSDDVKWP